MGKYIKQYGKHKDLDIVYSNTLNDIELEIKQLELKFSCLFQIMVKNGLIKDEQEFEDMMNSLELMNKLNGGE